MPVFKSTQMSETCRSTEIATKGAKVQSVTTVLEGTVVEWMRPQEFCELIFWLTNWPQNILIRCFINAWTVAG